jgi:hypothetical protein
VRADTFAAKDIAICIAIVAFAALAIVLMIRDHNAKQSCIESGGVVHEYDCHAYTSCSNGSCSTTQSCSWQCVGGGR